MAGLSLLPEVPKLWDAVAGLFGKKTPKTVADAGKLAGEVLGAFKKGEVPPEVSAQLEERMLEHKEVIMQKQNERMQIQNDLLKAQMSTQVQLWANETQSNDQYVRRTRPKILRQMWQFCCWYALVVTAAVAFALFFPATEVKTLVDGTVVEVPVARTLTDLITVMKYFGTAIFSTFTLGFLGYTTARTIDKKNGGSQKTGGVADTLVKLFT
jgi:hypothetical protein